MPNINVTQPQLTELNAMGVKMISKCVMELISNLYFMKDSLYTQYINDLVMSTKLAESTKK